MLDLIMWLVFGGVVGWIASLVMGTDSQQGIVANIVIGIVGAFIGGFLARTFLGTDVDGFNIISFLIALGGAILLIFIMKVLFWNTPES